MAESLRVALYDESSPSDETFRAPFAALAGLEIAAGCSRWQELQVLLSSDPVDAVIVRLDSASGESNTTIVRRITELSPQCAIIGISESADPEAIIAAMRAGCHQFVRWPVDQEDLDDALKRVGRARMPPGKDGCRIGVIGSAGGAGATTIACNLAIELACITKLKCALLDMDLQYGDVACSFDLVPRYSLADVCQSGMEIDRSVLESAMTDLPSDVSVLGRPETIEQAEEIDAKAVERLTRLVAQLYPFVVLDLPRYFSPIVYSALGQVDRVLIVTQLSVPQLRHTSRICDSLLTKGATPGQVEIVFNRCNAHFERITPEEAAQHLGRSAFAAIPNDYKRVGESRDHGHPIMANSPNSPARLAIQDLARRLAGEHAGQEQRRSKSGGLLGIFRR